MRITKNQIRQIIKEELAGVLREKFSEEELAAQAKDLSRSELTDLLTQMPDNAALNSEFSRREVVKADVAANSPFIQALTAPSDVVMPWDKPQTATEKPPAKVDESRRRKVRRTRKR
tara:strand:+ start:412 stop:762 length:351 start_codon:yes stop_codon:yes gene_type:complete